MLVPNGRSGPPATRAVGGRRGRRRAVGLAGRTGVTAGSGRIAGVTTLVFLHAHPDDEALLTAGTMARAAAEGQRVVLVVATDGAEGLASSDMAAGGLAARRG